MEELKEQLFVVLLVIGVPLGFIFTLCTERKGTIYGMPYYIVVYYYSGIITLVTVVASIIGLCYWKF